MLDRFANWMDERFAWRQVWDAIFLRKVPHVNWLYTLGSATLFVATIQIVTGILLTLYYVPTPDHAYDSVMYITTQLPAGWLITRLASLGGQRHDRAGSAAPSACLLLRRLQVSAARPLGSQACCSC